MRRAFIMANTYLIENFVNTRTGDPYRLFPFGKIVKGGIVHEITPDSARNFKLPHFKPPIKLGAHDDPTPAGGHIVALEVREDGLYAVPEWNDKGSQALQDGAYRYHSPEVIWEDGGLENPENGAVISGPLVLGDALLHTPHLGEATALYSVNPMEVKDMEENMTIPKSFWDKFVAPIFAKEPEKVEVVKEPEDYAATKIERDELKAKIEKQEAEAVRKSRVEKFDAELMFKLDKLLRKVLEKLGITYFEGSG